MTEPIRCARSECRRIIGFDFLECGKCEGEASLDLYCDETCYNEHDLEVHIGPRERLVLAQWRELAKGRNDATPS